MHIVIIFNFETHLISEFVFNLCISFNFTENFFLTLPNFSYFATQRFAGSSSLKHQGSNRGS